jgi:hypothetical protein
MTQAALDRSERLATKEFKDEYLSWQRYTKLIINRCARRIFAHENGFGSVRMSERTSACSFSYISHTFVHRFGHLVV